MTIFVDLSTIVTDFATKTGVILTYINRTLDVQTGVYTESTMASDPISGCLQPASGIDLKKMPENYVGKSAYAFWTTSAPSVRDFIKLARVPWLEVVHVYSWGAADQGAYTKVLLIEVEEERADELGAMV